MWNGCEENCLKAMASASVHEDENEKVINLDASLLNQLMYSIGRLKFTLRTFETLNFQLALLPAEDTEANSTDCPPTTESNKILENVINDVLCKKSSDKQKIQNERKLYQDPLQNASSLEDLELIQKRLQDELQKIRLNHQTAFSKKAKNSFT